MKQTQFIFILIACIFISLSLGQEDPVGEDITGRRVNVEALKSYWTPEKMRNAIPRDLVVEGDAPSAQRVGDTDSTVVDPVSVEGRDSILFPSEGNDGDVNQTESNGHSKRYPFPFSAGFASATDYTTSPWRTVGKVFFTSGGLNYVCSASVIRQYAVATAGHCVYDRTNGYVQNFVFVPGYNNGATPYGVWYNYQLWVSYGWYNNQGFCADYGFSVMQRNVINNVRYGVGDVVGYLGYTYNAGYNLAWRSLGYPAAAPFNGQVMYYADSALGVVDSSGGCTPNTMGIGSSATGGASGGPWIYQFGNLNYLNSVNSYKYNNQPDAIYGPYFDSTWFSTLSQAAAVIPP
jgi:V8-like Glu-specific endopeptidase